MYYWFVVFIEPTGTIDTISLHPLTDITYRITWEGINCFEQNGEIIGYRVTVERTNNNYYTSIDSTVEYESTDVALLNRGVYNVSIAVINTVGVGPFSDRKEINLYSSKD